jgi:Glycosyl transferases group 1
MKLAVFYPQTQFTPWSMGQGIVDTLARLGHSVLSGKLPSVESEISEAALAELKSQVPTLEALVDVDLVLLSGPELMVPWLEVIYGKYEWKHGIKAPKVAWYQSPFFNDNVTINFDVLSYWADEHFFPAIQDAEFFDQEGMAKDRASWLPFGVDTCWFHTHGPDGNVFDMLRHVRPYALGHVGFPTQKGEAYMGALGQHEFPAVRVGQPMVVDLEGFVADATVGRVANAMRRIKVFVNFPGANFVEAKLLEAMACGALVLSPMLTSDRGTSGNQKIFENGTHWILYRSANVPHVAAMLREWSSGEKAEEREKIALAGAQEVHAKHSLDKRLEAIFAKVGLKVLAQQQP